MPPTKSVNSTPIVNAYPNVSAAALQQLSPLQQAKLPWQTLVQQTLSHPKFSKDYDFSSLIDNTWVQSKPFGDW